MQGRFGKCRTLESNELNNYKSSVDTELRIVKILCTMLQQTMARRAIYSIISVTVLDPFLFHFVVTYFVRPSAMISDVVVSLPGGSQRPG